MKEREGGGRKGGRDEGRDEGRGRKEEGGGRKRCVDEIINTNTIHQAIQHIRSAVSAPSRTYLSSSSYSH